MNMEPNNIAIIGTSGAIGGALAQVFSSKYPHAEVHTFSQHGPDFIDYNDEKSIESAALAASKNSLLDLVIVANGILHDTHIMPEKSLKELSSEKFHRVFAANTITPAMIGKYFIPKLKKTTPAVFAALSARVGSISDNRLGGWYAYRSSKAALNMIIKNAAIEVARYNKQAVIVGLHPGTVDSRLSKPYQGHVSPSKLFTPEESATKLHHVILSLTPSQTGQCFDWNGELILP